MLRARAEAMGDEAPGEIELAPDEVDAVALFTSLATQWKWHPTVSIRTGLDYAAIAPTAAGMSIAVTPTLFADLRTMEIAAMAAWSKQ